MPQPIQVPQTTPNAPQFQPPTDLVNAYLARKQQDQQFAVDQVGKLGQTINTLKQQGIQNQLNRLAAISQLYAAGGPRAVNQYMSPTGQPPTQNPQTPQTPPPPQTPTAGLGGVQDNAPSPYIQASLAQGHPDVAGVSSLHAPVTAGEPTASGQPVQWNAPQPNATDLADIESGGTYGRNKAQSFKDLGDLSMQPLTAEEKQTQIKAANAKFATPEQGAAIASGDPSAVAGAYGGKAPIEAYNNAAAKQMEKNKTAASEISKQGPLTTEVKTLQGMFDNVDKDLHKYYSGNNNPGSANVYRITKGRMGSAEGADVLNQSAPLVAAINKLLTSRFNMGENELLSGTIAPSPNDTPKYAASKMRLMHQLIQAMDSGNKENVSNVISAMNGNVPEQVKANGR